MNTQLNVMYEFKKRCMYVMVAMNLLRIEETKSLTKLTVKQVD